MSIITRPRWSLGRGKTAVPSRWQATVGLVLAAVVYAVVKPGPCSETAVCIFDTIRRACRPGPCESRTSHVGVLVLIAAASAAAGVGISLLREARSRR